MATPNKPVRVALIAGVGVSTFYVSAHLAGGPGVAAGVVEPIARPAAAASAARPASAVADATAAVKDTGTLPNRSERERAIPKAEGQLFANRSWLPPPPPAPPPPPPPPPAPPPVPVAPPLPFTFVGMLERGAPRPEAFLAKGDALLVVAAGDTIDNNTYRVDVLNANEVVLTYLPLNIQQTLNVSGRSK